MAAKRQISGHRGARVAAEEDVDSIIRPDTDYLEELEDIESDCRRVPPLLIDLARRRGISGNSPLLRSMLSNVESIAERCREERERFGLWREDGLEPGDIIEEIDRQLTQFLENLETVLPKRGSRFEKSE